RGAGGHERSSIVARPTGGAVGTKAGAMETGGTEAGKAAASRASAGEASAGEASASEASASEASASEASASEAESVQVRFGPVIHLGTGGVLQAGGDVTIGGGPTRAGSA